MSTHRLHYRYLALALLWAAALLRFVDLQILAVLLESIKIEFHLNDTELGLLGGAAFGIFYGVLGVPVAWLAEHCSRRSIIAIAVCLWSLMTLLCGKATSFATLFLARMGVGIGEAGAYPPTTSLLADYFPAKERSRACAILASAIPIGVLVGFAAGSFLNVHYGWRLTMQVLGLPGILLGLLIMLFLREPTRTENCSQSSWAAFKTSSLSLWQTPSFRLLVLASSIFTMGAVGSGLWFPSFYLRHHGLSPAQIGLLMAALYGTGGLCGSLLGGFFANKRSANPLLPLVAVCRWSLWMTLPFAMAVLLAQQLVVVIASHFVLAILMHMNIGPVLSAIQHLATSRQRALAHAWLLLITNVIGLPLGPLFVGWISDNWTPTFGSQALGLGILVLLLGCWSVSAWLFGLMTTRNRIGVGGEPALIPGMPESG